ncbi:MAG TPA: DciA family protein [Acetobacteraceae bacterium]|nr:DciA family protein [Acetobacteraceae bacterium]
MASAGTTNKKEARHPYGPRPIAALLPVITGPAFRRRSPAVARLLADWEAIVGPALASVTAPERCAAGTLSLACAGPVALELQHLAPKLIERINAHWGRPFVTRLRFHQVPLSPSPRSTTTRTLRPEMEEALSARLRSIPEGALREALERLGRAIASEA